MGDLPAEGRALQDLHELPDGFRSEKLLLDDKVETLLQQRDEIQVFDLAGDAFSADGEIRLPGGDGGGHGQVGFHDFVVSDHLRSGDAQPLELHIHQDPGGGAHPAVEHRDVLPRQILPAPDVFGVALLDIEALGPVADVDQHGGNTGHQTADEGGVIILPVIEVAGRHLDVVLVQRQQTLEAVEVCPGRVDALLLQVVG